MKRLRLPNLLKDINGVYKQRVLIVIELEILRLMRFGFKQIDLACVSSSSQRLQQRYTHQLMSVYKPRSHRTSLHQCIATFRINKPAWDLKKRNCRNGLGMTSMFFDVNRWVFIKLQILRIGPTAETALVDCSFRIFTQDETHAQ